MDFLSFLPKKMQENITILRNNPKEWAKFNLRIIAVVISALCALVAYQFIKVIIGFNTGNSSMNIIGGLITFLIMLWVIYNIYKKGYVPQKERLMHYINVPEEKINKDVDVDKVVNEVIKHFEDKAKKEVKNVL